VANLTGGQFTSVANFIGFTVLSETDRVEKRKIEEFCFGKPYGFAFGMLFILPAIVFSPLTCEYR
jgi:hypothetical protein